MEKNIYLIKYIILFFLLTLIISCGTEKFIEPEYLNSPTDLTAYPKNNQIKIKFYSSNKEDKFDGFNIYISKSSSLKTLTDLLPVKNPFMGSIPTINKTSKDINFNVPIEITIQRDANDDYIENGIRYYLIVKAHSIRNFKSEPCNENSTTPRIDNLEEVTIYENEGFNFSSFNKTEPYQFIFKIINNKPFLIGQNNAGIQSKGYYENWELVNQADEEGYVNSPLKIKEGYVFLLKTVDNYYGKIQVTYIELSATPYIKIIWAFQQNLNNKDI